MSTKTIISTSQAPAAIGTYSQAVRTGSTVYCSGQIPLDPETMTVESGDFAQQARRVFQNLKAVIEESGGSMNDIVKLTVYLTDLANFGTVNEVMASFFDEPYPARAAVGVSALPKDVPIEVDAIVELP